ncbi:MAG: hypothetical protein KAX44_05480, partial [Candidatus Brocadiae bacterium]|nr:hypothetical protein [Candidatus Brocadiia bacterium]
AMGALVGCGLIWRRPEPERPPWVPAQGAVEQESRFISANGSTGPGGDFEELEREADRIARQKLAEAISEYTRNATGAFLEANPDCGSADTPLCGEFISALASQVSAAILRRSVRQDAWRGPRGKAYVLYRLPLSVVDDEINESMRYGLDIANPFGAPADEVAAGMELFLDERLRKGLEDAARERPVTEQTPPEYRPPAWLEVGRHENYPAGKFLSAIGLGADEAEADRSARAELASGIHADLVREMRDLTAEEVQDALAQNVNWLAPQAAAFTEKDVVATRIPEHWYDPLTDTHYAFAVVDCTTAELIYRHEVSEALKQSAGLRTSAQNHRKADNYAASLRDYLDALSQAGTAVKMQLRAIAVAPAESATELRGVVPEPILADLKQDVRSLLENVTLEKIGGDGQWVPPGVPLRKPLQVRLLAGDKAEPVAGVPIKLTMGSPGGKVAGRATTDGDGAAGWQLAEAPAPESRSNTIVAELDLGQMAPAADLFRLDPPRAVFTYVLRARSNTLFALHVRERTAEGLSAPTTLTDGLKGAMKAEGFLLVEESEMLKHLKAGEIGVDSPEPDVLNAFSALRESMEPGSFLLIVIGETQTQLIETVKTSEGDLHIVHCPFKLKVLDPDQPADRRSVLSVSGTGQGAYTDNEPEATKRARADAAASAVAQLLGEMREKLAPGAAER